MYDKYIYLSPSGICGTGARGLGVLLWCLQQCLFLVTVEEMGTKVADRREPGLLEVADREADVLPLSPAWDSLPVCTALWGEGVLKTL